MFCSRRDHKLTHNYNTPECRSDARPVNCPSNEVDIVLAGNTITWIYNNKQPLHITLMKDKTSSKLLKKRKDEKCTVRFCTKRKFLPFHHYTKMIKLFHKLSKQLNHVISILLLNVSHNLIHSLFCFSKCRQKYNMFLYGCDVVRKICADRR